MRQKGFTLIELMVVVAIIGIIAAVAYPSYVKSGYKGRRSDAKAALNQYSQVLERCYANYGSYNNANCTASTTLAGAGYTSQKGYYTVTGPTLSSTSYTLIATAVSGGAQAGDTGCTVLGLLSTGKQISGSSSATSDTGNCW